MDSVAVQEVKEVNVLSNLFRKLTFIDANHILRVGGRLANSDLLIKVIPCSFATK